MVNVSLWVLALVKIEGDKYTTFVTKIFAALQK